MSGRGILDADMRTLGRWAAAGWRWWLDELGAMLPIRLRRGDEMRLPTVAMSDDGELPRAVTLAKGARVAVTIPQAWCLARTIERPRIADRDLPSMIALESAALLPLPPGTAVLAARTAGPAGTADRMLIEVAGLPIPQAQRVADVCASAGIVAARVGVEPRATATSLDFAPAMRAVGVLPPLRRLAPAVWAAVGLLAALNLAVAIWRDQADVDRLDRLVAEQAPGLRVVQTIARRTAADRRLIAQVGDARARRDAVGTLARVTAALPAVAWLQRYDWQDGTVRLTGYRPPQVDVAAALRAARGLSRVRPASDDAQPATPAGTPFDLSAVVS